MKKLLLLCSLPACINNGLAMTNYSIPVSYERPYRGDCVILNKDDVRPIIAQETNGNFIVMAFYEPMHCHALTGRARDIEPTGNGWKVKTIKGGLLHYTCMSPLINCTFKASGETKSWSSKFIRIP